MHANVNLLTKDLQTDQYMLLNYGVDDSPLVLRHKTPQIM